MKVRGIGDGKRTPFFEVKWRQKWFNSVIWKVRSDVFRVGQTVEAWGRRASKNRSFFEVECPKNWSDSVIWKVEGCFFSRPDGG